MKNIKRIIIWGLSIGLGVFIFRFVHEQKELERIIDRLSASSRAAEVLVTGVNYNEKLRKNFTTIKFLEYDVAGKALEPRFFTFPGNVIQFQSLVVRFDDRFVMAGDRLKGKSVYLFWKAFMLDGANTKEFPISYVQDVPEGYAVRGERNGTEQKFWRKFWKYALNDQAKEREGIKNVQIEAPGTMFVPGYIYTIKIEHDGGLRIDVAPLPQILNHT